MSNLPLSGLKLLDLSPDPDGSLCARSLCRWGAERIALPPGLDTQHAEGKRILLLLVQEVDILISQHGARDGLDLALLQEYNPMLIVCHLADGAEAWAASSAVLAALLHRGRTGLGQNVDISAEGPPAFSGFVPQALPEPDPDRVLARLGYDAAAIADLRRTGILRSAPAPLRENPAL
jgi:crotonobetainyl-CoA:carnitine CoA-transferase CaiB-like acyl-CoA transferase